MVLVKVKSKKPRVVMAMSGGVDSTAAAVLLVKQGYDVVGVSMKLWPSEFCGVEKSKSCCSTRDIQDARQAAAKLGIPFYAIDLSKEFKKEVIDYFCDEYLAGRTPNPCIVCNEKIKFGRLLEKAKSLNADFIATGHYAKAGYDKKRNRFVLKKSKDKNKDQSYVLFGLAQHQLKHTLFPLEKLTKPQARQVCRKMKLKAADKPESQEICFIPDNNYAKFLIDKYAAKPVSGEIVSTSGEVIGKHQGLMFFTVGQRKGLGLGGNKNPLYVVDIDIKNNRLVVGSQKEAYKKTLFADNVNWINAPRRSSFKTKAKIRYNHIPAEAVVCSAGEGVVRVDFKEPQFAITPGQAVVFYNGDEVLGGGWIR